MKRLGFQAIRLLFRRVHTLRRTELRLAKIALDPRRAYSARNATIGFTRVARRAGTKHEAAATAVSSAATVK